MRIAIMLVLTLVLLCIESVAVKVFGFSVTRIDVTLALVVFLGLRANTAEGAITSFCLGSSAILRALCGQLLFRGNANHGSTIPFT